MKMLGLAIVGLAVCVAPVAARSRAPAPVLVSMRGTCDHLRVGKRDATGVCDGHVVNLTSADHVVFVFGSTEEDGKHATVVFGGRGPLLDVGAGKRAQAVGMVGFTYDGHTDADADAVGVCEYTNPYEGVAHVACSAVVDGGRRFEAGFTTDGAKPKKL